MISKWYNMENDFKNNYIGEIWQTLPQLGHLGQ